MFLFHTQPTQHLFRYHWSLVLAPKDEKPDRAPGSQSSTTLPGTNKGRGATTGTRFHAKQVVDPGTQNVRYRFAQESISLGPRGTNDGWPDMVGAASGRAEPRRLLTVRVLIAKTSQLSRLADIISRVPVRNNIRDWDSEAWVKDALVAIDCEEDARQVDEPLLVSRAVGTEYWNTAWRVVRHRVWEFYQRARDARHAGETSGKAVPTHDLLTRRDVVK